ncbi:hypothetical protein Fmac_005611 [Flemingia macrophylla]|uniref:Aminotransferase-like plant mobile domain-containing protein n=1 Tax=Flemingia macrophylla TaxID=520843 RepID=A0ABD1N8T4_9FABA
MQRRQDENWALTHVEWIDIWNNRGDLRLMGHPVQGPLFHTRYYMQWYMANSIYFLSVPPLLQDPRTSHQQLRPTTFETGTSSTSPQRQAPLFHEPQTIPEANIIERRHSIATTSEDFYSNLFGVDFVTPSSAQEYIQSLYRPDFPYEPGSSSAAPQHHDPAPQNSNLKSKRMNHHNHYDHHTETYNGTDVALVVELDTTSETKKTIF